MLGLVAVEVVGRLGLGLLHRDRLELLEVCKHLAGSNLGLLEPVELFLVVNSH